MDLKIEKVAIDGVLVRMPFNPSFCADEDETLLHGGVLTALLDNVFGLANFVAIVVICVSHGPDPRRNRSI